jgi:protein-disulfide isomerase
MEENKKGLWDKISLPVSIILAGLLIAGGIYLNGRIARNNPTPSQQQQAKSKNLEGVIRPIDANDHVLGNPKARVLVVEYSDTECPYCKVFHSTMNRIMQNYGQNGDVAWVYRYYPIAELHPKSFHEAEATECAATLGGNSKFWEYINKVYETTPSNNGLDPAQLTTIATQVGFSSDKFNTCLNGGEFGPRINLDIQNAKDLNIAGTPWSVIIDTKTNQYYPVEGAYPYETIKSAIDMILKS